MPIVQAGKQFTKDDILQTSGNLAAFLVDTVQNGTDFGNQINTMADPDLVALGLTQEQIDAIKGFYVSELAPIAALIRDSFFLRSLIGLGV
jgi:hypothetical protein